MKSWLIKKLGGYTEQGFLTTDDFIEHLNQIDDLDEKRKILTHAVSELFNTIDSEELLRTNAEGEWTLKGHTMTTAEMKMLRESATYFLDSKLFKIIEKELHYHCNLQMKKSVSLSQLDGARMIEYTWDIILTRINELFK